MSFNIKNFKSNIVADGYLKNNYFEVWVQPPSFMQNSTISNVSGERGVNTSFSDMLRYRIEQVRVPGISLTSNDMRVYGIGPTQKMPYAAQIMDTTFSVLVDRRTDIWDFWYNWVNRIFNVNGADASGNRQPTYTTSYKEDYATTMVIVIYDNTGKVVRKINLLEAFPSALDDIPLAWNDTQGLIRLGVAITFTSYTTEEGEQRNNNTNSSVQITF